jgi:hypothetical protein
MAQLQKDHKVLLLGTLYVGVWHLCLCSDIVMDKWMTYLHMSGAFSETGAAQ